MKNTLKIGILGGGPAALLAYREIVESGRTDLTVFIFERSDQLGAGMPYSRAGARKEHVTNVSGNEIPEFISSTHDWLTTLEKSVLDDFSTSVERLHEFKVMPRLLFGMYLSEQFRLYLEKGMQKGLETEVFLNTKIDDVIPDAAKITVKTAGGEFAGFDDVIICTGHNWPHDHEGKLDGYFDSPYPPEKIAVQADYAIALKGSSLTAIDALRTLARCNGTFNKNREGRTTFALADTSPKFRIVMHSREGLLPAVRFHLEDPHLAPEQELTKEEIECNRAENNGFLSLDFVFERNFVEPFRTKNKNFYDKISRMSLEEFVEAMMDHRNGRDAFDLLKAEYAEAERSIRNQESVQWKEMLAVLSFVMNYPAKYFSAEDMQRLKKVLQPLISVIIAFAPQESVEEMMALKEAGVLSLVAVGQDSEVRAGDGGGAVYEYTDESGTKHSDHYKMYIDCSGQPHLSHKDVPFKSLIDKSIVTPAMIAFRNKNIAEKAYKQGDPSVEVKDDQFYLKVPGVPINDHFQVIGADGKVNEHLYMMAVPYIGGYNPDYSGLDFCEEASQRIMKKLLVK